MKNLVWILLVVIGLSGCETLPLQLQTRADRASLSEDQRIAQQNQRRMAGRIESLEMQISQMDRDLDTLRSQLDSRCASMERKSEEDKREMVSRLSAELDRLMKQAAAAKPAAAPASSRGIEHVIKSGETLYIIAKAYGVSAKTITDVNKIADPGRLSVGQKLFIPQ